MPEQDDQTDEIVAEERGMKNPSEHGGDVREARRAVAGPTM
jgi:hypothetical protein